MADSGQASLQGKHILLGICGGIAAYKTPALVRLLRQQGAEVEIVLTENAERFVSPMALQAVSGRPVRQTLWDPAAEAAMGHIELARWADHMLIAPATANTMAKLAHGQADDLLTTLALATRAPVSFAPAMNQAMYLHAATQANLQRLADLGYNALGPDHGDQACGDTGPGRMLEPEQLVAAIQPAQVGKLSGKTVMITTGPTLEAIDPVRFISNHSSGLQGLTLAEAALQAGADVILIAGPGVSTAHSPCRRINVRSARDMYAAVHEHLEPVDLFIGVAAVADYRPATQAEQKMKRSGEPGAALALDLVENPDIIASVAQADKRPAVVVGFAAETNDVLEHGRVKLARKNLDAVVVNDVSDQGIGFNSEENAATFVHRQGEVALPRQAKSTLSVSIIQHVCDIFAQQLAGTNPASVTK